MISLQHILEAHLSSEEVDHRRGEKYTCHRDQIDEGEIPRKEEESDKDEWGTRNQCESSERWEEKIDEEERTPELFEKLLQRLSTEEKRIIEVVGEYTHKEYDPDDYECTFDPERENLEHYGFLVTYMTAGQKFLISNLRDWSVKYRFTSPRFWNAYWYCM